MNAWSELVTKAETPKELELLNNAMLEIQQATALRIAGAIGFLAMDTWSDETKRRSRDDEYWQALDEAQHIAETMFGGVQ